MKSFLQRVAEAQDSELDALLSEGHDPRILKIANDPQGTELLKAIHSRVEQFAEGKTDYRHRIRFMSTELSREYENRGMSQEQARSLADSKLTEWAALVAMEGRDPVREAYRRAKDFGYEEGSRVDELKDGDIDEEFRAMAKNHQAESGRFYDPDDRALDHGVNPTHYQEAK